MPPVRVTPVITWAVAGPCGGLVTAKQCYMGLLLLCGELDDFHDGLHLGAAHL
jgi:hypothetical protein